MKRTVILVCLIALAAAAATDPTAAAVLEQHRDLVGVETIWNGLSGLRLAGEMNLGGMAGEFSIALLYGTPLPTPDGEGRITAAPFLQQLHYRLVNDLPALHQETYLLPGGGYSLAPNGELRELAGEELEAAYTDAVFETFLYCYPSGDVYDVVYLEEGEFAGEACHVLRYQPHYDAPLPFMARTCYFAVDDGAFLGHRSEYETLTVVVTADAFTEFEGLTLATDYRLDMGEGLPSSIQHIDSYELNPELAPADFQPSPSLTLDFPAGADYVELPCEQTLNLLFVEAVVNGEPCRMVLDSGAGMSCLDAAFADELGLEVQGELPAAGAGGTGSVSVVTADGLELGGLTIEQPTLITMDFSPFARALGADWDGILGYEIFARLPVSVDYAAGLVRFHDPAAYEPPEPVPGRVEILPLEFEGNLPVVRAAVEDHDPAPYLLDLGNSAYTTVHAPAVDALGLLESHPDHHPILTGGFGGMNEHQLTRLETFHLGAFRLPATPVVLAVGGGGVMEGERLQGNIGQAELARFARVTLDYTGKRLILEAPDGGPGPAEPVNTFGVGFTFLSDTPLVVYVWEDSPAAEAGLHVDDELVSFADRPAADWSAAAVAETLTAPPGSELQLTVRRDGEELELTLTARELL